MKSRWRCLFIKHKQHYVTHEERKGKEMDVAPSVMSVEFVTNVIYRTGKDNV